MNIVNGYRFRKVMNMIKLDRTEVLCFAVIKEQYMVFFSPGRRQAITCKSDGILLIEPLGTKF